MAHIAIIAKGSNIVRTVLVVANSKFLNSENIEVEQLGIDFLKTIVSKQYPEAYYYFKQTSYNGNFRTKFAGIGDEWNENLDAFISPKPYPSWTLNTSLKKYVAPTPYPQDGKAYSWNEDQLKWELTPILEQ